MPQRILPAELTATPERELWIENVKLRAEYLNETQLLTEAEVDSTFASDNERVPVSQWKREAKVFSVRQSGIDLYPAFQFSDGAPLPVIERILAILPKEMSDWQVAMWFASGNGWLGGDEPQQRVSDPDAVVVAAQRLADPAVG